MSAPQKQEKPVFESPAHMVKRESFTDPLSESFSSDSSEQRNAIPNSDVKFRPGMHNRL